jgi:hypothetical protein
LPFSCRLTAIANATGWRIGSASKTQKSPDLARRKAVGWNGGFGGFMLLSYLIGTVV